MTRRLAPFLAIGVLVFAPSASAAPPGTSSCMGTTSYFHAQSQGRDDQAHIVKGLFDTPGRSFYINLAQVKTAVCD